MEDRVFDSLYKNGMLICCCGCRGFGFGVPDPEGSGIWYLPGHQPSPVPLPEPPAFRENQDEWWVTPGAILVGLISIAVFLWITNLLYSII